MNFLKRNYGRIVFCAFLGIASFVSVCILDFPVPKNFAMNSNIWRILIFGILFFVSLNDKIKKNKPLLLNWAFMVIIAFLSEFIIGFILLTYDYLMYPLP